MRCKKALASIQVSSLVTKADSVQLRFLLFYDMQVGARLVSMLLLTLALTMPEAARPTEPVIERFETPTISVQSATVARYVATKCRRCQWNSCRSLAVTCRTCCDTPTIISPLTFIPGMPSLQTGRAFAFRALRERGFSPDPHPPKRIALS